LIGSNGAGKTTTSIDHRSASSQEGSICSMAKISPALNAQIVEKGIAMVRRQACFCEVINLENLEMGAFPARIKKHSHDIERLSSFPRLKERAKQSAGTLSGGRTANVGDLRGR
jgi:branched-chain amino acid transport system ATP-binding protein